MRACASLRAGEYQQDQTQNTHIKRRRIFFFISPLFFLSLCVCVPTLHGAYPRTGAKIAAVRYDNSDIAASAYGKMTMVRLCFFVQVSYGHNGLEPISRDMLLCLTKKKNDNDRRAAITQCANRLFVPPVSNCCTYDRRGGFMKGETDGFPISKSELKNSCSVSVICWNLSTCSAIQREREKKNKSVGEECDSTLLVPLASSRTMHFLHPLPPSPKKTFSTASYTCFFFPFYICCCGLIIIPRPSIKNDDNSVVTSVVDVC